MEEAPGSAPQTIAARTRLNLGSLSITNRVFLNLEKGSLRTDEERVASGRQAQTLTHAQMLITGATSGLVARFFTHPMDTVKARLQVQGALQSSNAAAGLHAPVYASISDAFAKILKDEGRKGFYRGFGAVVTAVPVASAVYFWGYEFTKQAVGPSAGSTGGVVVGGMVAQAAAGLIYTPMDVIKERQQVQALTQMAGRGPAAAPLASQSSLGLFVSIVRKDGPIGLFKGYWTSNLAWWPWNIIYFVTYEQLRAGAAAVFDTPPGEAPPPMASAGCATVAATVATTATAPIDVVKTRLQALPKEMVGERGALSVAAALLRQEGPRAVWSGTLARVLSIAPGALLMCAAISFFAFESLKERWARV